MNTEQSYVGRGNNASSPPPAAQNAAQTSPSPDDRLTVPFNPNYITIDIAVWHSETTVNEVGTSPILILLSILEQYKEGLNQKPARPNLDELLDAVDEIRGSILFAVSERLSASCDILFELQKKSATL